MTENGALSPSPTRWSWNMYPSNRIDGTRMIVPLGCLYTPIASRACEVPYKPLKCVCGGILNPYCQVDYRSKTWECAMCCTRNAFSSQYASITEHQKPTELYDQYTTIEYCQPVIGRNPPTFVFVLDSCVDTESEIQGMKEFVLKTLQKIPEKARVCLITFGAAVQIHEINGMTEYQRSIVLRGNAEITPEHIKGQVKHMDRYVVDFSEAEFCITNIIDDFQVDAWPAAQGHRPLRATGAAISAAASILSVVSPHSGSLILTFLSGVCTEGPGKTVGTHKRDIIRHQADIRDKTPAAAFWDESCAFYDKIMRQMVHHGHSLNVFVAALDQVGLAEMKPCIQSSGGIVLSAELWRDKRLEESMNFFFRHKEGTNVMNVGLNATIDVITSPTLKVAGVIGQCVGTGKKSPCVSEVDIGIGGTCQWTASLVDSTSTFAIYFETATPGPNIVVRKGDPYRYAQFVTTFESGDETRIRVTTVKHMAQEKTNFVELMDHFDQLASTVLIARMAVFKTETIPLFDVLRWLDRTVIRLVSRFGSYKKDQPQDLSLPRTFSLFPAFMYHLRRSACLQIFNSSPDETTIIRLLLSKAPCDDGVLMVQPALYSYSMDSPPKAVPLDSNAINPNGMLLMDTFYDVLVYRGDTIQAWKEQGYDQDPNYAHFAEFLKIPSEHGKALVEKRYPTPRYFEVHKKDGNSRILLNRLNPSRTHNTEGERGPATGELILTDDVSLGVFIDQLKKLAVLQQ
eukprot:Tbor_TRINITY_DN5925_c1_g5::TRINITY_DN5925_c1_g5_i1::g.19035::m.19035/K14006/SEC23; protein transport protein SEC23